MAKTKLINDKNRYACAKSDKSGLSQIVANLSEVSKYILNKKYSFLVVICCFIVIPVLSNNSHSYGDQGVVTYNRESRKLFGGYRITPQHCKATRASRFNQGPTICMFNHECKRREGEVVGACMDGFLFGACCQLKETSDLTIPEGPGVVVTGNLDKHDEEIDVSDQSASFDDHFNFADPNPKPTTERDSYATKIVDDMASTKLSTEIRTTDLDLTNSFDNYHQVSTEKINSDILTDGVNQIADSLLNGPSQADRDQIYNFSTLGQNSNTLAETILYHTNGTEVNDVVRPSDFDPMNDEVQISSLQTKPTMSSNIPTSKQTTTPPTLYTHKPIYQKPIFKPKPVKNNANLDKFVLVQTMSKPGTQNPISTSGSDYVPSIDSIIQMLNESSPTKIAAEAATGVTPEHKDVSLSPVTIPSISYTSGYPSSYMTQSHYSSTGGHFITTFQPPSTSYVYSSTISKRPVFIENVTKKPSDYYKGKPGASTINNQYFMSTNSIQDEEKLTTLSYVSSSSQSTTTRKPPSTSYVYNPVSSMRPESNLPTIIHKPLFDLPVSEDNFASVTPTVIVLGNLSPPKPKPSFQRINDTVKDPQITDNFVQISQEPYKKPVSQVTINNVISSTHNIHLNGNYRPVSDAKPSPTVVITPKPSSTTSINNKITRRPIKIGSTTPSSASSPSSTVLIQTTNKLPQVTNQLSTSGTLLVTSTKNPTQNPTTHRPELQTSPDDLTNFPPVRNPNLNATGSNPAMFFNGTAALSDDISILHDVEFTTPSFLQEDALLNQKMNVFVSKIVGSLQGTFQELHDIVILNKQSNSSVIPQKTTTTKPVRKPTVTTKKPATPTKKPTRVTTTTKRPTKKPTRVTVATRKPTTTIITTTTKRPRVTTKKPTKPTKRVTTTTAVPTTTSQYFADDITTEGDVDDSTIDYSNERLCGIRPLVKSGRIVGGKGANYGEFPWQVLVRESTWLGLFTKNKCGGVLISSRYVTTAAHCQPGFLASLVAVFGEHDISGDLESRRTVSKNVRRVIVHRQYDAATFENDLALLELDSPVPFDAHIVPICMPPDEADFTGRMATVTGWGRLKYGGGVPAVLQEVQVPVIENSVCQEMFQTAGHSKVILSSFMCAGYANGQKDSCEGDSGGPLVLQRPDGRWQLIGTVSHGIKCAAPYLPGVYMRTTFYKPWLKSITGVK